MFDEFMAQAGDYIQTNPWLAVVAVFTGGVLTASNPCVLAMIPLMMSFVAGRKEGRGGVLRGFTYSLVFVSGLGITFTVLGMIAALAGQMYGDVSQFWTWIVAGVCVAMGLHMADVIQIPIPALVRVQPKTRGIVGALLLGLLFGFVSAPCAAPILVVLLTYLAGSGSSVFYGGFLLLVYALGHSVLILVAGTSMGVARTLVENKKMTQVTQRLRKGAGLAIVLIGAFFFYQGTISSTSAVVVERSAEATIEAGPSRIESIVFVGQKEACECTRNRIDNSWQVLQAVMDGGPEVPVKRIQRDVDVDEAETLSKLEPCLVAPGIYFLDQNGDVVALLQGEVREDQIAELLR